MFHKVSDLHFVMPILLLLSGRLTCRNLYGLELFCHFYFLPHRPWCLKQGALLMVKLARKLCKVCKESDLMAGKILKLLMQVASASPQAWHERVSR